MKTIHLFPAILGLLAAAGCSDWGDDPGMNALEVETADVTFSAYGGTGSIVVKSAGGVTPASSATWCVVAGVGSRVEVTVPVNNDLLARAAAVTIRSGAQHVQVPVLQAGAQIEVERHITISAAGGATILPVHTPCPPVTASANATWLATSIVGDQLILNALPNTTAAARTATLSLTAGPLTAQVAVTQSAP
jgi:hypothetical protein